MPKSVPARSVNALRNSSKVNPLPRSRTRSWHWAINRYHPGSNWIAELAGRLRSSMLRHRDGGRLLAGTYVSDESMWRTMESTLRTLEDAGFSADEAGWVFPIVLHYTVGFVIEEQARTGADYGADNPYAHIDQAVDRDRYPRTANLVTKLSAMDPDDEFDHGVRVILTGIRTLANIER